MMLSNAARREILERALQAAFAGDTRTVRTLCTDDVTVWAPGSFVASLEELVAEIEVRDEAFSNVALSVSPLDVSDGYACAEWTASMTNSGPLVLPDASVLEPTGVLVNVHGVSVAEFRDDQICAVRQYGDELSVLEQLGVLRRRDHTDVG